MNALLSNINWPPPVVEGLSLAAVIDHGTVTDEQLAQYLSKQEMDQAQTLAVQEERRHYMFRRAFQTLCVAKILGLPPEGLNIRHHSNERPTCAAAPHVKLSFSSSGNCYLIAVSTECDFGVDIEKYRSIPNVAALAQRFFTEAEAKAIAILSHEEQIQAFFKHWTLKEAGLKALGKGVVDGLNTFILSPDGHIACTISTQNQLPKPFESINLELSTGYTVTLVHNGRRIANLS